MSREDDEIRLGLFRWWVSYASGMDFPTRHNLETITAGGRDLPTLPLVIVCAQCPT